MNPQAMQLHSSMSNRLKKDEVSDHVGLLYLNRDIGRRKILHKIKKHKQTADNNILHYF